MTDESLNSAQGYGRECKQSQRRTASIKRANRVGNRDTSILVPDLCRDMYQLIAFAAADNNDKSTLIKSNAKWVTHKKIYIFVINKFAI